MMRRISPLSPPQGRPADTVSNPPKSGRSRNRIRYPVAAAALVAAFASGAEVTAPRRHRGAPIPAPAASNPAPALTVTTTLPRQTSWPVTLQAWGAIAPWQEASVGTQIGGYRLIDVRVNVGDPVRKGEVLARLDPALLRAEAAELQANYDQAEANRRRAMGLKSGSAISNKDVLQYVTQAATTRALLEAIRLKLGYTDIVAPDDGVISARTAMLGAVVAVGSELFRLIRQNRLEWHGELTASQLAKIAPGQPIELTLPDGTTTTATVREAAPMLDVASRLATVYADLAPGRQAHAGMFAEGRVILNETRALVVPADSIVIRDGYSAIFQLSGGGATGAVTRERVTLGRRQGDEAEILGGLAPDARIVVRGAGFLEDGDVVRLADGRG